jgi:HlyD family secretion protein
MEGSGGSFVYVLDAGGHHAERRDITTGRRNPEQVEMTAGLAPGDRVITSSYANFTRFTHLLIQ